jgi:MFS family permease
VWSAMTVICGMAQTFWQLALARVGVGMGESGAIPPAQSLIADYFPPESRASALAIFTAAGSAGYVLGIGAAGYVAAAHGWRVALFVVGAPGLLLAVLVRFTLSEPRLRLGFQSARSAAESVGQAMRKLRRKRSYLYALSAFLLYFFFSYGVLVFVPSYLVRTLQATLADVSVTYGGVTAVGSVIGTLGGGWLADRLGRRDVRWLAWMPAIALIAAAPVFFCAFLTPDLTTFLALALVGYTLLLAGLPAIYAAVHTVCGSARRAMAIAIMLFSATLLGGGFGPLLTGAFSDALSATYGALGLRYSMMIMIPVLMASGILCVGLGRAMPTDIED